MLANRLKHLFSHIINENQNALMSKCHITDNVLMTLETMHHLSQKNVWEGGGSEYYDEMCYTKVTHYPHIC